MLALFDLDGTLLDGDSNHLWGEFLTGLGVLDPAVRVAEQDRYEAEYHQGTIDFRTYLTFTLAPLAGRDPAELRQWQQLFKDLYRDSARLAAGRELVAKHRARGHQLILITATGRFFAEPLAELFDVHVLLASEAVIEDGRFTGAPHGEPCYGPGKLVHFETWAARNDYLRPQPETWFYSDSHNDLPLLKRADHAFVVHPDARLRAEAHSQGWPILMIRD